MIPAKISVCNWRWGLRCLLLAASASPLVACRPELNVRKGSTDIRKLAEADGPIPAKEIASQFDRRLLRYASPDSVVQLSTSALRELFDATFITAFSGANPRHAMALGRVFAEMSRRGQPQAQDVRDFQGVLILVRDFDAARKLKAQYPTFELESIPAVVGTPSADGPSSMELSADGKTLEIQALGRLAGPRIVIISSLSCGPSNRALEDIGKDAQLRGVFEKYASWVMPPQSILDAEKMALWNTENPGLRFRHALSSKGWQGIDTWNETPIFYFLMDGQQKAKVIGWPKAGRWNELRAGLKTIGLM